MSASHTAENPHHIIYPFVSGHTRAQWVTVLLMLTLVLNLAGVMALCGQINLLSRSLAGQRITPPKLT